MSDLTPATLTGLRAIAQKATPGPWEAGEGRSSYVYESTSFANPEDRFDVIPITVAFADYGEGDAEFIAAFNPETALALLDAIKELTEQVAEASNPMSVERRDYRIALLAERDELQARIDKALACYGPDPSKRLGESRYGSADDFLIAIRAALTTPTNPTKEQNR